jgi:hypothetical protein
VTAESTRNRMGAAGQRAISNEDAVNEEHNERWSVCALVVLLVSARTAVNMHKDVGEVSALCCRVCCERTKKETERTDH